MSAFTTINSAANAIGGAWFAVIGGLPDWIQLVITAVPVTLFALGVFRLVSDQEGIRLAKAGIKAHLLELWLFKDDPAVLLRAQAQVFLHSFTYLGYSLVPLLVMLGPVALLIVQIESRFAFQAPAPGEPLIVTATMLAQDTAAPELALPPGLVAETPALRIADRAQVLWRIRGDAPGSHEAVLREGAGQATARIVVGEKAAVAPAAYRENDWRVLGFPVAQALPADSAIVAIEVAYPRSRGEWLGLSSASWLLCGVTIVLGFALRGALGVTF